MGGRFEHSKHVLRVAGLFGFGFLAFLILRQALVPADFGVYGYYRAGALDDIRAQPVAFAGRANCVDCHDTVLAESQKSKHKQLSCEACHGPLARHAAGNKEDKAKVLNARTLCVQCHLQLPGKPESYPQVDRDHGGDDSCTASDCHKTHSPKIEG